MHWMISVGSSSNEVKSFQIYNHSTILNDFWMNSAMNRLRQCFTYIVRRVHARALVIHRLHLLCAVIAFVRGLCIGK